MANITFTNVVAGGVADLRLTKSEVSAPRFYADDLIGCGSNTHIRTASSGNFNSRSNCSPPFQLMTRSVSALTMLDATAVARQIPVADTAAISDMYTVARNYLSLALVDAQTGTDFSYDGLPFAGMVKRGNVWRFQLTPTSPSVIQVALARLVPQYDQCGNLVGIKGNTSFSEQYKSPLDCVPYLRRQISISIAIRSSAAGIPNPAGTWTSANMNPSPVNDYELGTALVKDPESTANPVVSTFAPLPFTLALGA